MKRLRFFSLLLILALLLPCGVHAADVAASQFSDWESITRQPEVAMLTDLGLISGYADGTFRPLHCITRAETARIIACLLSETLPEAADCQFPDAAGTWAAGYIQFCADRGVISGDGSGNFRPTTNVTARELARMLISALGWRITFRPGEAWTDAVDRMAKDLGLYAGYKKDLSLFVSREDACLMINNALQCSVVTGYEGDKPVYALDDMMSPMSMLQHRFQVMLVTGVVEANAVADLRTGSQLPEESRIHIGGYTRDFAVTDQVSRDMSLLGHQVTLYARFYQSFNQVFGLPRVRTSEAVLTLNSPDDLRSILDNSAMSLAADIRFYEDLHPATQAQLDAMVPGDTLTLIDHESDGIIDIIFIDKAPPPDPAPTR